MDTRLESDLKACRAYITELEQQLHGTVTTAYHDSIVQEAVTRAAKAEQELARLQEPDEAMCKAGVRAYKQAELACAYQTRVKHILKAMLAVAQGVSDDY